MQNSKTDSIEKFSKSLERLNKLVYLLFKYIDILESKNYKFLQQILSTQTELLQLRVNMNNITELQKKITSIEERCGELITIIKRIDDKISILDSEFL